MISAKLKDAIRLLVNRHRLKDSRRVAVKILVGRLHLDVWNPDPVRADDVGSADDADLGLDGELVVLLLAVDDGDGAAVGFVVVVEPGEIGVLDDHVALRGALDAVVDVAVDALESHVCVVGGYGSGDECQIRKGGGQLWHHLCGSLEKGGVGYLACLDVNVDDLVALEVGRHGRV